MISLFFTVAGVIGSLIVILVILPLVGWMLYRTIRRIIAYQHTLTPDYYRKEKI